MVIFKSKGRRRKLQNRHVDPGAVLGNVVEDVVQGTCHIKARRHPLHREHPRTVGRTPHGAQMNVTIDDARLQHESREVNGFFCFPGEFSAHGSYFAFSDRHVGDAVHVIQRIHDMCVTQQQIVHGFLLKLRTDSDDTPLEGDSVALLRHRLPEARFSESRFSFAHRNHPEREHQNSRKGHHGAVLPGASHHQRHPQGGTH